MNNRKIIIENELNCPMYFENHNYGGLVSEIENLINHDLGVTVRTIFINSKPYFCAVDICKGLSLDLDRSSEYTMQAVNDIIQSGYILNDQNKEFLDPPFQKGGAHYNIFEYELYYYLNINLPISNQYGSCVGSRNIRTIFISEPVLYMLTFKSRKREAIRFKAWLSIEVLPKMRFIGRDRFINIINNETMDKVANQLQDINEKFDLYMGGQNATEERMLQGMDMINYKLDSVGYMSSSVLNSQQLIVAQQCQTNDKVTAIASGLNTIFG